MKNVDIRTVKREELADIGEVKINKEKSREIKQPNKNRI